MTLRGRVQAADDASLAVGGADVVDNVSVSESVWTLFIFFVQTGGPLSGLKAAIWRGLLSGEQFRRRMGRANGCVEMCKEQRADTAAAAEDVEYFQDSCGIYVCMELSSAAGGA